ncbi:1-deoxy-D-xylulose-5-phosphate reductoisomerase [Algihabitans albus]|uniref:1-deoxy-D-xylulose-5-phosphate reductoisomerase n=1 Tax=Algihabitans albus TaxID=2164067 RepID=UPI000E5D0FCF|nr:1-deoxy-D-xylulose-5-phosphate reductoisomerase [Algihabitans albus]
MIQDAPRSLTVLGATGSIGASTLDLVRRAPESFQVEALTAHRSAEQLAEAAKAVGAKLAVVADPAAYDTLKQALSGSGVEAAAGVEAVVEAAERPADFVMSAIVGAAGLAPTLAAVRRGAVIGLANKETLVCAGALFKREVERAGATLLPVDSEHNAIFQVLDRDRPEGVEKIILTASGGPFRSWERDAMSRVTPEQAVAHPNWSMGAKISVDSATMMNKGLEVIEAAYLFDQPRDRIEVLVHPQSVVHSMVAYVDGSVLAQLGAPDMRTPIAYSLAWPARMHAPVERLDLGKIGQLTFEAPDEVRFPALRLAREALATGAGAPSVLNAANEIAVAAFLNRELDFLGIADVVESTLERLAGRSIPDLDSVLALDHEARRLAQEAQAR